MRRGMRGNALGRVALLFVFLLGGLGGGLTRPQPASAAPVITEIGLGAGHSITSPSQIVSGPDGALWFTLPQRGTIGRMTTTGAVSEYAVPSGLRYPQALTIGPDGAFWFTLIGGMKVSNPPTPGERYDDGIGRLGLDGNVTEFILPAAYGKPLSIAPGADGALWFTTIAASGSTGVARITTAGATTFYAETPGYSPGAIIGGPDGALWFTTGGVSIGRISTSGVITHYPLGDNNVSGGGPGGIVVGPDGALWFAATVTAASTPAIGRITTAGAFTSYPLSTNDVPSDIAVGPDGAFWFTASAVYPATTKVIGRMTTTGSYTEYPLDYYAASGITKGPDGALWFTDPVSVGRIAVGGAITKTSIDLSPAPRGYLALGADGAIWISNGNDDELAVVRRAPGGELTQYKIPPTNVSKAFQLPKGLILGPDGAIWFTTPNGFKRIAPDGTITTYPTGFFLADELIVGPDGALWTTSRNGQGFERITMTGERTEYPTESEKYSPISLAIGPDGGLWFVGSRFDLTGIVGRFSTDGHPLLYNLPDVPTKIVSGPDGALWFSINTTTYQPAYGITSKIGRMTTAGDYTEFSLPSGTGSRTIADITFGSDGALWFVRDAGQIGRMTATGAVSSFPLSRSTMVANHLMTSLDGTLWFTAVDPAAGAVLGRIQFASGPAATIGPGGVQATQAGNQLTLSALPDPGAAFTGWRTGDLAFQGWASPLTLTQAGAGGASVQAVTPPAAIANFAAVPAFTDLGGADAETANAIRQLAARGIIRGYQAGTCQDRGLSAPCFGPGDHILRAQMAALIARAAPGNAVSGPGIGPFTWAGEDHQTSFTDRSGVDDALWRNVGTLQFYEVAKGFGDGTYHPVDDVAYIQVVSFVTRAMVKKGYWVQQPDDPALYPNVPLSSGHHQDLVTYLHYVGAGAPGFSPASSFADWTQPAPRGWFALTLWRALDQYWSQDRTP